MSIPEDLASALDALTRHVLDLATSAGVSPESPWSLGEAGVFGSFPWLHYQAAARHSAEAIETLSRREVAAIGGNMIPWRKSHLRSSEKLGLLLLLGMCWAAREDSIEGTIWPHVRESDALKFFAAGGTNLDLLVQQIPARRLGAAPTELTKRLIKKAVTALNLRNALEVDGVHRWVLTLNLQFGIPCRAFRQGGADWLRGAGRPQSIEYLLGEKLLGGHDLSSRSFQQTWRELKAVFRGRHDPLFGSKALAELRWASGNDWKKMIDQAVAFNFGTEADTIEELPPLTRSDPHLRLDPTGPRWLVGISIPEADSNSIADDILTVLADGRPVGRIERNEENASGDRWHGVSIPEDFPAAATCSTWVEMRHSIGPWREVQAATIGAQNHAFSFPLTDEQQDCADEPLLLEHWRDQYWIPCKRPSSRAQYILALPPALRDVEANWQPLHAADLMQSQGAGSWSLRRLQPNNMPLELRSGEFVIWSLGTKDYDSRTQAFRPTVDSTLAADGKNIELRVTTPVGAIIDSLLDEDRSVAVTVQNGIGRISLHHFEPKSETETSRSTITVRAVIRAGERRRTVRKKLRYPYPHFTLETEHGTIRHPPAEPLHLTEFATPRLIGAPTSPESMTPFIFEGAAPRCRAAELSRPSGRRNTLVTLNDGGTLEFCGDLVNRSAAGGRQRLACGAINTGAFINEQPAFDGTSCSIKTARPGLTPDDSWCIELLTTFGQPLRSTAMQQPESDDDPWLRATFAEPIDPDQCLAARLVVGSCVRGLWQRPGAISALVPEIDSRSRWLTMMLWELLPPHIDSDEWKVFIRLFRTDPRYVLTPPDQFPLEPSPTTMVDLDDRHFALVEMATRRLTGKAEEASIISHLDISATTTTMRGEFSELGERLATAIRYSPVFAAILMNARDSADCVTSRSPIWSRRRMAVAMRLRAPPAGPARRVEELIELATGQGSMLASLFPAGSPGIDPHFVLQSIEMAREAFRQSQFNAPALENLRILWNMTRREGHIARAIASRLIEP